MIEIPKQVTVVADEFLKRWPVVGASEKYQRSRLAYQDTKTPVPHSTPVIVEFTEGNQTVAEAFAIRLRAHGYETVETELVESMHQENGTVD